MLEALGPDVELVVLAEPFFAREPDADVDELASALDALDGNRTIALPARLLDAGPALGRGLGELPVGAIGIDFHATNVDDVPDGLGKTVLAGSSTPGARCRRTPDEVAAFAARLREQVEDVALVPNGDLQFVSEPIARQKVARLGEARTKATA